MVTAEPLAKSVWSRSRWLVLAPHPDDETLGAGALIAHTAACGRLVAVAYLTDGTGSHPAGTRGLGAARQVEARKAVGRLAGRSIPIDWLEWQDAHPAEADSPRFRRDAMWLGALLRRRRVDAVAVTDRSESHCDHIAAYQLAEAAVRQSRRSIALFTYHVWSTQSVHAARRVRTKPIATGQRVHALRAHRSQLSNTYGEGFRLPPQQRRMMPDDVLTLQENRR